MITFTRVALPAPLADGRTYHLAALSDRGAVTVYIDGVRQD